MGRKKKGCKDIETSKSMDEFLDKLKLLLKIH